MVDITFIELHVEDGTFNANFPFSGVEPAENEVEELVDGLETDGENNSESDSSSLGKSSAILGVFLFMVVAVAIIKYVTGDDSDGAVDIDSPVKHEAPAGLSADE